MFFVNVVIATDINWVLWYQCPAGGQEHVVYRKPPSQTCAGARVLLIEGWDPQVHLARSGELDKPLPLCALRQMPPRHCCIGSMDWSVPCTLFPTCGPLNQFSLVLLNEGAWFYRLTDDDRSAFWELSSFHHFSFGIYSIFWFVLCCCAVNGSNYFWEFSFVLRESTKKNYFRFSKIYIYYIYHFCSFQ